MTVSPTRPSGRSGWGLSCFVLGYLGSSILILPLAPRRGAWSSYFPTPKPPGPNPPGTPPIQDPGGPRKPASPLKNKEGGAEPWNPGLGRRPSGGGEAQDTPPAVLSQFLATPPASLASPPPRARVGHELPSPKPRCGGCGDGGGQEEAGSPDTQTHTICRGPAPRPTLTEACRPPRDPHPKPSETLGVCLAGGLSAS